MKNQNSSHQLSLSGLSEQIDEAAEVYQFPVKIEQSLGSRKQLDSIAQTSEGVKAIIQMACDLIDHKFESIQDSEIMISPDMTKDVFKARLAHLEHEEFGILLLDNKHRVIAFKSLFRGTIDSASVYPREVVKEVLKVNAAACCIGHNHPSGQTEPSQADISLTRKLKEALALIDVRVLDHIVVGAGEPVSLAASGLM